MTVKLVISISRKPGTTPDEFYQYWREVHGPMFLDRVPLARQYISKYEQYHIKSDAGKTWAEGMAKAGSVVLDSCEGISVLSADTLEDLQAVLTSKQFLDTVNPDNLVYAGKITSVILNETEKVLMYERDTK